MSRIVELGSVRVLDCASDGKEQALKVLEEAAEVVEAWKHLDIWQRRNDHGQNESAIAAEKEWVADELADVITAACGLASGCGIDMAAAMGRCEKRNRERGRLS